MSKHAVVWDYKAGVPYRNRVRVYERAHSSSLMMEWAQNGSHYKSLRHSNKTRAVKEAEAKAAELEAALPKTHEPTERLVAMRADLIRVARLTNQPDGVAPSCEKYRKLGSWTDVRVRGAFLGYRRTKNGSVNPRDTWTQAMHKFGLKTVRETQTTTTAKVAADVRRVAMLAGKPGMMPTMADIRRFGRYQEKTVMLYLRVTNWVEAADYLQLAMDPRRREHSAKVRAHHLDSELRTQLREAA